ncbi:hypothetical protein GCM10009716_09700 [Streptomyces sodiiphilus]|uniref:Acyl-CoA dehydrogenase n=1 Tax=Streptomyces sodiiphilus TaxID=226217 RepID=A0ABN2NU82_9ACTN
MSSVSTPDAYAHHALARMVDYFTEEGMPWPRRLWDIGSVLALEELWEAGALAGPQCAVGLGLRLAAA